MPKLNLMPYPCQNLSWSILTPSFWKFPNSIIHYQFILLKRLLTEDIFSKTSSDKRYSRQNIFSQKISEPNVFSQKTKNVPLQLTNWRGISYIISTTEDTVRERAKAAKNRLSRALQSHTKDVRSFVRFLALTAGHTRARLRPQAKSNSEPPAEHWPPRR